MVKKDFTTEAKFKLVKPYKQLSSRPKTTLLSEDIQKVQKKHPDIKKNILLIRCELTKIRVKFYLYGFFHPHLVPKSLVILYLSFNDGMESVLTHFSVIG